MEIVAKKQDTMRKLIAGHNKLMLYCKQNQSFSNKLFSLFETLQIGLSTVPPLLDNTSFLQFQKSLESLKVGSEKIVNLVSDNAETAMTYSTGTNQNNDEVAKSFVRVQRDDYDFLLNSLQSRDQEIQYLRKKLSVVEKQQGESSKTLKDLIIEQEKEILTLKKEQTEHKHLQENHLEQNEALMVLQDKYDKLKKDFHSSKKEHSDLDIDALLTLQEKYDSLKQENRKLKDLQSA
ncbi:MAG: hypothetical protein AAF518_02580 [Spirochaetota bacterium]